MRAAFVRMVSLIARTLAQDKFPWLPLRVTHVVLRQTAAAPSLAAL